MVIGNTEKNKKNMCWNCLNEYRCDWIENIDGRCEHFTEDIRERNVSDGNNEE